MLEIQREIAAFRDSRESFAEAARQTAALRLLCNIDLSDALARTGEARLRVLHAVRRTMERERLKGISGKAGYSLDRHIALKRSLDRLAAPDTRTAP